MEIRCTDQVRKRLRMRRHHLLDGVENLLCLAPQALVVKESRQTQQYQSGCGVACRYRPVVIGLCSHQKIVVRGRREEEPSAVRVVELADHALSQLYCSGQSTSVERNLVKIDQRVGHFRVVIEECRYAPIIRFVLFVVSTI